MAHHVADTPQSTSGTPSKIKTKDTSVGPHKRASSLLIKKKIPPTDATAKAAPDVTAKTGPGVTAKAAPDATAKAAPGVTPKAAPDVTAKAAPVVTAKAAPDVPANIRDNVLKFNETTSKNASEMVLKSAESSVLNAANHISKDSEDFKSLRTLGSDSDPFLSDPYNSKNLMSPSETDPLLLPGPDSSLKDKEKQERRKRKKEKKEKRALGLLDEFPKEQSDLLNMMVTLNQEDLNTKLKDAGNNLVVIDFFAKWCGPCKMISPKIEELAKEYPDVVFLKVDVDECEDIASEFEISSMPTFVFIKSGAKLETFSGANFDKLKETLLKHK